MITPDEIRPPRYGNDDPEAKPFTPKTKSAVNTIHDDSVRIPITSTEVGKNQPSQMSIADKDKQQKQKDPHKRCFGLIDDRDGFLINFCKYICIVMFLPFALIVQCFTAIYEKCIVPCCKACGKCCKKFGRCLGKGCAFICDALMNCLNAIWEGIYFIFAPICTLLGKCCEKTFSLLGSCCEKIFELAGECCEGIYKVLILVCDCCAKVVQTICNFLGKCCQVIYKGIKIVCSCIASAFISFFRMIGSICQVIGAVISKINRFLGKIFRVLYKYTIEPILNGIVYVCKATRKCIVVSALAFYKGICYVFKKIWQLMKKIGALLVLCLTAIYQNVIKPILIAVAKLCKAIGDCIASVAKALYKCIAYCCTKLFACIGRTCELLGMCCEKTYELIAKVCELTYKCIAYICKGLWKLCCMIASGLYKYLIHPIYKGISYVLNGMWKIFKASVKASYKVISYCCRKIYEGLKLLYHYTLRPVLLLIRAVFRAISKCLKADRKSVV